MFGPSIIMAFVCVTYYFKYIPKISTALYWVSSVIALTISIIYAILLNYRALIKIKMKLKEKLHLKRES